MLDAIGWSCALWTLAPCMYAASAAAGPQQVLELTPSADNPRNSEGDFIALADGRLLFVYTHFTGGGGDESAAFLASRVSADGGQTWSGEDAIVLPNEGGCNVMSVSLLRLQSSEIALFYLRKNTEFDDCILYLRRSMDEGQSWSEPVRCIQRDGFFVVNNNRVIQLKSGRLVIPAALHGLKGAKSIGRGTAMCFLSDDNGATWYQSTTELTGPPKSRSGLQEPDVTELKDGRLLMLFRTDQGCQLCSHSADGGVTWSPVRTTSLQSPVSPASVERIPSTGDLIVVWNDHSDIDVGLLEKRTPLKVAISRDEGLTWEHIKTVEDDPGGWYCYTAIAFAQDHVLLGYCAGQQSTGGLNRTQITRIPVAWLYE
ncbi:MAG: sialidase [Candidatus Hydrogenedentes bacterium]|nr:sialidase [Candidatus Hydrogenedentota bacterium]